MTRILGEFLFSPESIPDLSDESVERSRKHPDFVSPISSSERRTRIISDIDCSYLIDELFYGFYSIPGDDTPEDE